MRSNRRALLFAAAAVLTAAPALAQEAANPAPPSGGLVRIDPCTGKPYTARADSIRRATEAAAAQGRPDAPSVQPGAVTSAGAPGAVNQPAPGAVSPAGAPEAVHQPAPGAVTSAGAPGAVNQPAPGAASSISVDNPPGSAFSPAGATVRDTGHVADPATAARNRAALRLGSGSAGRGVRLGPAASVSVPTAFGVDAGELFVGVAYQGRTRFTEDDDAAAVAGLGIGTRRLVALEIALTSYSTLRGEPLETGGLSFKLHRLFAGNTSLAVGWENALLWGGSDDRGSLYAVGTRVVPLRRDATRPFGVGVVTLGVGNGRFRFEDDYAADKETVNVFGAVGIRVNEPLSLVADWTGQDLNLAASVTPIRRVPLVLTTGVADVTGLAGDGARFILSLGYGLSIRQPF